MLSYTVYKVLHLAGVFTVLFALSATIFHVMCGGTKQSNQFRRTLSILHGVGLLVSLVAGFGLLARLGIMSSPLWVVGKIIIWLIFGLSTAVLYRKPSLAKPVFWVTLVFSFVAVYLAVYKPM